MLANSARNGKVVLADFQSRRERAMMKFEVFVVAVVVPNAFAWKGIIIPAENNDFPGQVFSPYPMPTVGQNYYNFGINSTVWENVAIASCGDTVYVTGGLNPKKSQVSDAVFAYDVSRDLAQSKPAFKMTQKRYSHTAVCLKQPSVGQTFRHELIICGGNSDGGYFSQQSSCERCDTHIAKCHPISDMPMKSANHRAVAAYGGRVYVAGGYNDKSPSFFAVYDAKSNNWTKLADMNGRRAEFGMVHLDGGVLVCGGWIGAKKQVPPGYATCEMYDPLSNSWSKVASLNHGRMRLGMVDLQGEVFVLGGIFNNSATASIERYDWLRDKWTLLNTTLQRPVTFAVTAVAVETCD